MHSNLNVKYRVLFVTPMGMFHIKFFVRSSLFRVVIPSDFIRVYQAFGVTCGLHLQG